MTRNNTDGGKQGGTPERERAGQAAEGVGKETDEVSEVYLAAQRELEAFIGRVAGTGGHAAGRGGKRRKSKAARSGGLSPFVRRLLRMFVCFRAFQIFPLLALCFIGAGGRSRYRGKGRRNGRAPRRAGGGGGRGSGRGRRPGL